MHVGMGDIGVGGVRPQGEGAGLVGDGTGPFGGENYLGARDVSQHLVRTHRVEGGEAVIEGDDDLHGAPSDGNGGGTRRG